MRNDKVRKADLLANLAERSGQHVTTAIRKRLIPRDSRHAKHSLDSQAAPFFNML
jgi:hypothetical protein